MRSTLILLLLLMGSVACKTNRGISTVQSEADSGEGEQILFLNFYISQDSAKAIRVSLVEHVWVEGAFKEKSPTLQMGNGVLVLEFLDKNQQMLSKHSLSHPVKVSLESFAPSGNIERKEIHLKQTTFTVRANVSRGAAYVRVNDINGMIDIIALQ